MTLPAPGGPAGPPRDPQLDFFSRSFNPYLALATAGLLPPLPAARLLDSIFRCRFMLPDGHPDAWREQQRPVKSKEAQEAAQREKQRLSYLQQKAERERLKTSPLDIIAQRVREGPMLLLKRCYQERARVRVVTRHARGVRGTSEGTLVAFDKYMNLVLRDVEEQYTVLLNVQRTKPAAAAGGRERVRNCRQQEHRRRQLRQVFVRGDSVVLVAAAGSGAAEGAAARAAADGAAATRTVAAASLQAAAPP